MPVKLILGLINELQLADLTKGAQRAPGHVAPNPNAKAPVLEHHGFVLWESWFSPFERVVKPVFGMGEADAREIQRGNQLFERAAKVLDSELQQHRYVAGDRFTAADLSVGADMSISEAAQYPLEAHAAIRRWYDELRSLPSWQKTAALQHPRT